MTTKVKNSMADMASIAADSTMTAMVDSRSSTVADARIVNANKQVDLTVTASGWTTTRAKGIYYATQDGSHRLRFNITGALSTSSRTSCSVAITGITTVSVAQAISGMNNALALGNSYASANTNTLNNDHASASTTNYYFSGDIELASKPAWA